MTTLEKIRAEIKAKYDSIPWRDNDYDDGWVEALEWVYDDVIDKYAEQEQTDEWQNGYNRAWEEAEVFYEKEEPTIPCDLCGFNTGEFCEYLSVCPATGKAVSKCHTV